jgi:3,4-dihydroxy 2-butanone 4-phosphate synthase/GTP cyclohydrolase II
VKLPTDYGTFDLLLYRATMNQEHHLALVKGDVADGKPVLVRVHSECLTGDVFASRRCDCGSQLHTALKQIEQEGAAFFSTCGRRGAGIGLAAKIHAYKLQEDGFDTVQANFKLGFPSDLREYGLGAQILFDLGVRQLRLLTNNPKKVVGLAGYGLKIVETVPIRIEANVHNKAYLRTKRTKMGHIDRRKAAKVRVPSGRMRSPSGGASLLGAVQKSGRDRVADRFPNRAAAPSRGGSPVGIGVPYKSSD